MIFFIYTKYIQAEYPTTEEIKDESPPAARACEGNQTKTAEEANLSSEIVSDTAEKVVEDFPCDLCDFRSNWENGLRIHMNRKHHRIEQLDGNVSVASDVDDDEKYSGTEKYWKSGILGTCFQYFLDANEILDICVLDVEVLNSEKLKVLEARKCAFGDDFKYYPPWRK